LINSLEKALQLHRNGEVLEALHIYESLLRDTDPHNPLALYGVASIQLSHANLNGLTHARKAIFEFESPELDKIQAAESIIALLLQNNYQEHARNFINDCFQRSIKLPNISHFELAIKIPGYLDNTRFDKQLMRELQRYRPIESQHYVYAIDIVGGCNLRCPTCPVGQKEMPKGLMSLNLFKDILHKIKFESIDSNPDIWLFNWTEPLLHPKISNFIQITHDMGMTSFISTNLNMSHRIEELMRSNPTRLKVSLSSLKQSIYSKTHVRGDIDQVVLNLHQLAKWRDHFKSSTQIWIGHHLYRNTIEEQTQIRLLAHSLGFHYAASPAIVAPIEKVMEMTKDTNTENIDGLRQYLLCDPLEVQQQMSLKRSGKMDCELRFNMTAIQYDGQINLCCGTTQPLSAAKSVSFLEKTHKEIENMKYDNSFCKACIQSNLHLTAPDL